MGIHYILVSSLAILDLTVSVPANSTSGGVVLPSITLNGTSLVAKKLESVNITDNEITDYPDEDWIFENKTEVDARRILYSKRVPVGKRPYMVYLQLTKESAKAHKYRGWLCGGVIVSHYYVLTSAACVEDADHFYVVSGTTKFVDSFDFKSDECVCNHRRRVVWKCIPKNYKFDFQDSIKWSSNDIAIVKVSKSFKFGVVEKGCEFGVDLICYNNVSRELEKAGTKGFIAGWGSGTTFREGVYRRQTPHIPKNAKYLQEAKVCVMDNEACSKKWAQKFRDIITTYMVCTKDVMKRISEICDKKYANCTDVELGRRTNEDKFSLGPVNVDLGRHLRDPDDYTARRTTLGGFCENDHGGPLIVKYQGKERVIGVISACKIDPKTHSCHGPFLYTSVFKNRQFISCAINKDIEENCRRVFRSGITHEEWTVDWDSVADDDDDDNRDDNNRDDDNRDDNNRDDDNRDESAAGSSNESGQKKVAESGEKQVKDSGRTSKKASSSDSDSSEEVKKHKKEKKEKKESKDHKKGKGKKNKRSRKKKSDKKTKRSKRDKQKADDFYESSKEDNVNDPDAE